jgi:hypothetical protein
LIAEHAIREQGQEAFYQLEYGIHCFVLAQGFFDLRRPPTIGGNVDDLRLN